MAEAWTYPIYDARTGELKADNLPIACESFSDGLGVGVGEFVGAMRVDRSPIRPDDALMLGRRIIVPCYHHRPMGAYLLTNKARWQLGQSSVPFVGNRIDLVLFRRPLLSTQVYIDKDQLAVAHDLAGYGFGFDASQMPALHPTYAAALYPLGDWARIAYLEVEQATPATPRIVKYEDVEEGWQAARDLRIGNLLVEMASEAGGFEVRLDYRADPFKVVMRFGQPALGGVNTVGWEYPNGKIRTGWYAEDISDTANVTRAFGAGQGLARKMGPVQFDPAAADQGWPMLYASSSSADSDDTKLAAIAQGMLQARRGVNRGWNLELDESALLDYSIGDQVPVKIRDPRFGPRVITLVVRVVGHRVKPSANGVAGSVTPSIQVLAA